MKSTLRGLALFALTFSFSILIQALFEQKPASNQTSPVQPVNVIKEKVPFRNNDTKKEEIIPFGDYNPVNNHQLWFVLYSSTEDKNTPVAGFVRIGSQAFKIVQSNETTLPPIDNVGIVSKTIKLSFETEKIKNVSYKFEGMMTEKDYKEGETAFFGKLQKIVKGKIVKETVDDYVFRYHACSG